MWGVLRRLRLKTFTEGVAYRYLKYAFGEVVLIVVGILLTLQINVWKRASENRKTEARVLAGIIH